MIPHTDNYGLYNFAQAHLPGTSPTLALSFSTLGSSMMRRRIDIGNGAVFLLDPIGLPTPWTRLYQFTLLTCRPMTDQRQAPIRDRGTASLRLSVTWGPGDFAVNRFVVSLARADVARSVLLIRSSQGLVHSHGAEHAKLEGAIRPRARLRLQIFSTPEDPLFCLRRAVLADDPPGARDTVFRANAARPSPASRLPRTLRCFIAAFCFFER